MPQLSAVALLNSTAADNDLNMHSDFCVLQVISSLRMHAAVHAANCHRISALLTCGIVKTGDSPPDTGAAG